MSRTCIALDSFLRVVFWAQVQKIHNKQGSLVSHACSSCCYFVHLVLHLLFYYFTQCPLPGASLGSLCTVLMFPFLEQMRLLCPWGTQVHVCLWMLWVLIFFKENGTTQARFNFLNERRTRWSFWSVCFSSGLQGGHVSFPEPACVCVWWGDRMDPMHLRTLLLQWILHLAGKHFSRPAYKLWWQCVISLTNEHCYLMAIFLVQVQTISVLIMVKAAEFNKSSRW